MRWTRPDGGMYVWLRCPDEVETGPESRFMQACMREGVLYVPGQFCYERKPAPRRRITKRACATASPPRPAAGSRAPPRPRRPGGNADAEDRAAIVCGMQGVKRESATMAADRKPYVVGIVGGSASGKSAFVRDLGARLPAGTSSLVSQDNYYRRLEEQERDPSGQANFDLPTSFHRDCSSPTSGPDPWRNRHAQRVHLQSSPAASASITIPPADVILVEGLFLLHYEEIRALLDLRVFVEAKDEICKARRLKRDALERGYPMEHVEYKWTAHVLPAYQQFILPYRDEAHIIVTNHVNYDKGLEVVAHHVLAKLAERAESTS